MIKIILVFSILFIEVLTSSALAIEPECKAALKSPAKQSLAGLNLNTGSLLKGSQGFIGEHKVGPIPPEKISAYLNRVTKDISKLNRQAQDPANILLRLNKIIRYFQETEGYLTGLTMDQKNQDSVQSLLADMADHSETQFNACIPQNLSESLKAFYKYDPQTFQGARLLNNHFRNLIQRVLARNHWSRSSVNILKDHVAIEELVLFKILLSQINNRIAATEHSQATTDKQDLLDFSILDLNDEIIQDPIFRLNLKEVLYLLDVYIPRLLFS